MKTNDPDFAILIAAAYTTLTERLLDSMIRANIEGMRPSYGFVIRAVANESPTINRLAELLGVSKQATSKLVDEMVAAGFLQREVDATDRRKISVQLTPRGTAVRERALEESASIERELNRSLGKDDVAACRRVLMRFLEKHGQLEHALARRARSPWK
jgi:DNA-binding MarR family transcriptional regulator